MGIAIGVNAHAYFENGLTNVMVYITFLEQNFPAGKFNVTCDFVSSSYIRQPNTATSSQFRTARENEIINTCNVHREETFQNLD